MLKEIKVGGITYNVEEKDIETVDSLQMGLCDYAGCRIVVNSAMHLQKQHQTLIHEMLHAIVHEAGVELENEETAVNQIGLVLYQVLLDNDFSFIRNQKSLEDIFRKEQ